MPNLEAQLHQVLPLSTFRPGQRQVIEAILKGNDVLAIWPTGAGKSLTYQLPALLLPHLSLVVSPLISLMHDQISSMHQNNCQWAACLTSNQSLSQQQQVWQSLRTDSIKLLMVSPERLAQPKLMRCLQTKRVSLIAVDEAHCISQWGHDFRPQYLRIREAVQKLQPQSLLALTATATAEICQRIVQALGMREVKTFTMSLDRPNIEYQARQLTFDKRRNFVLSQLCRCKTSAIVYVNKRSQAEQLCNYLTSHGLPVSYYHAGLSAQDRQQRQEAFLDNSKPFMIATKAFGMGIDKPDIELVIHYTPPNSLEEYSQESGRAGRQSQKARAILLWHEQDFLVARAHLADNYPDTTALKAIYQGLEHCSPEKLRSQFWQVSEQCWNTLMRSLYLNSCQPNRVSLPRLSLDKVIAYIRSMHNSEILRLVHMQCYASSTSCRRRLLLQYFGEQRQQTCANCDNCCHTPMTKASHWFAELLANSTKRTAALPVVPVN